MSVVRFRPWAPLKITNKNWIFTDFLLGLLLNLLPVIEGRDYRFSQARPLSDRLRRAALLACLSIVSGAGGLIAVMIVVVNA